MNADPSRASASVSTLRDPRIVTVCVSGSTADHIGQNARRLHAVHAVVQAINERWENLDAVVLPGLFFRSGATLGPLPFKDRIAVLRDSGLVDPLVKAAGALSRSPGVLIVGGIGGPPYPGGGGDQLCVAWNADGVAGIGRKIFPVSAEAEQFVCFEDDYRAKERVVRLPSGRSAVLCACYDMFGVAERPDRRGVQAKTIRRICSHGDEVDQNSGASFRELREKCHAEWDGLLTVNQVSVGLGVIHGFRQNSTAYWQKHGVATCSASLGGFAVGAAHFNSKLPSSGRRSPLAARNVPLRHLTAGSNRASHHWPTQDAFYFSGNEMIVRLYA